MRVGPVMLAMVCAGAQSATIWSQSADPAQVLATARGALGGETNLAAVKTFVATGRTRQIRGNNLVPIELEISCELPDKFVRKDEVPAQDTDLTITGFRGDELIQFPQAPPGRAGGPPAPPAGRNTPPPIAGRGGGAPPVDTSGRGGPPPSPMQQRLASIKQDFARLMLGVFATSFPRSVFDSS